MWEEEDRPLPRRVPLIPLEPLGVDELRAYIAELQTEIARAELAITLKHDHRGEAEKFFRR